MPKDRLWIILEECVQISLLRTRAPAKTESFFGDSGVVAWQGIMECQAIGGECCVDKAKAFRIV